MSDSAMSDSDKSDAVRSDAVRSDSDYQAAASSLEDWRALAEKQLKGRSPDTLTWKTAEGIDVKTPVHAGGYRKPPARR